MGYVFKNNYLILAGNLIVNDKKEILLLHRSDHNHYETPGGKLEKSECVDFDNPSIDEIKSASQRELIEELGNGFEFSKLKLFSFVKFKIPNGQKAICYKFITKIISGTPKIMEPNTFDSLEWLPINKLEKYNISADLKLLLNKLKEIT